MGGLINLMGQVDIITTLWRMLDRPNDATELWSTGPRHSGCVGFLTPMSSYFCSLCNHLHITSYGNIKAYILTGLRLTLRLDVKHDGGSGKWCCGQPIMYLSSYFSTYVYLCSGFKYFPALFFGARGFDKATLPLHVRKKDRKTDNKPFWKKGGCILSHRW